MKAIRRFLARRKGILLLAVGFVAASFLILTATSITTTSGDHVSNAVTG